MIMIKLDFVLISFIVFMMISGALFGLFRSLRILISLTTSITISLISVGLLKDIFIDNNLFNQIAIFVNKALQLFTDSTLDRTYNILLFSLIFVFVYILIYYLVSLFGPKKLKILSAELTTKSRIYGFVFGLFNGIFVSIFAFVIIGNLYNLSEGLITNLLSSLLLLFGI